MKIIGQTNGGFIAQMSAREAYNIAGLYSEYGNNKEVEIKVGMEVKVSDIYTRYNDIVRREGERKQIVDMLKASISVIDAMPSVLVQPKEHINPEQATH
jgi:hypothetical protein